MQGRKATTQEKKEFLEALERRKGIVTLACHDVNISARTFYRWSQKDKRFAQKAEEIREVEIGIIAEDRLAEAIIVNKDMNMVRFYLQSRNRNKKSEESEIHPSQLEVIVKIPSNNDDTKKQ